MWQMHSQRDTQISTRTENKKPKNHIHTQIEGCLLASTWVSRCAARGDPVVRVGKCLGGGLLTAGARLFLLRRLEAGVLGNSLPRLQLAVEAIAFILEFVVGLAEFGNRLLRK